jgi:hypothetical protein
LAAVTLAAAGTAEGLAVCRLGYSMYKKMFASFLFYKEINLSFATLIMIS